MATTTDCSSSIDPLEYQIVPRNVWRTFRVTSLQARPADHYA
jgi:hypothetical protein